MVISSHYVTSSYWHPVFVMTINNQINRLFPIVFAHAVLAQTQEVAFFNLDPRVYVCYVSFASEKKSIKKNNTMKVEFRAWIIQVQLHGKWKDVTGHWKQQKQMEEWRLGERAGEG